METFWYYWMKFATYQPSHAHLTTLFILLILEIWICVFRVKFLWRQRQANIANIKHRKKINKMRQGKRDAVCFSTDKKYLRRLEKDLGTAVARGTERIAVFLSQDHENDELPDLIKDFRNEPDDDVDAVFEWLCVAKDKMSEEPEDPRIIFDEVNDMYDGADYMEPHFMYQHFYLVEGTTRIIQEDN